jgi:hypothetical protein
MKKRQWIIRRHLVPTTDAQRRWDQAYQDLVQWSAVSLKQPLQEACQQEASDESSHLCTRFDATASANANH